MFEVDFSLKFVKEYPNFPQELQEAISQFVETFLQVGFDLSYYKGKMACSYRMMDKLHPNYEYAFKNNLWHYHLGIPEYVKSRYGLYYTSDMLVHFRKLSKNKIVIVDVTCHYKATGEFWLPAPDYLLVEEK